ncbi:MAG: helix-turn-helix transcriptional regulator [Butyrivibrio sp.]|nr:helix-turn-helix transcriptional regulator [Butyrivibrio sp.]
MYEEYARLRDALGVTDYYVGKTLSIPSTSLSQWKLGKRKLSMENLRKLATFFGVSLEQLMGEAPMEEAVTSAHAIADRLANVSDEAVQIALLYDRADERSKAITRLALDFTPAACL